MYALAEPWYEKYIEVVKLRLGENSSNYATSLAWLGDLYRSQGRYSKAETLYSQVLELYKRILGEDHPHTVTVRRNLEKLRARQQQTSEDDS